jgi:hypothetical protein
VRGLLKNKEAFAFPLTPASPEQGERAVMPTEVTGWKSQQARQSGLALQFQARERLRLLERNGRRVKAGMHALAL